MINPPGEVNLDDKEDEMYTLDDKSDGEGVVSVVVEESGGGVGTAIPPARKTASDRAGSASNTAGNATRTDAGDLPMDANDDDDVDGDGEEVELSDKGGDDYDWDEGYEQEV